MVDEEQYHRESHQRDMPLVFLITDTYTIGTPIGIHSSPRTRDMRFFEFSHNYQLQKMLCLPSRYFIEPTKGYREVWSGRDQPLVGRELAEAVAYFLAEFTQDPIKKEQAVTYLKDNGLVRILVTDDTLREGLDILLAKQREESVQGRLADYIECFPNLVSNKTVN